MRFPATARTAPATVTASVRFGIFVADQDRQRNRSHGIIAYSLGLISAIGPLLAEDETLFVYTNSRIAEEIDWAALPRVVRRDLPPPKGALHRLWLENFSIQRAARIDRLRVLHFPKGMSPVFRTCRIPFVATVMDDIPIQYLKGTFGSRRPIVKNLYVSARLLWTLRTASKVLTISDTSQAALARFCSDPISAGLGVSISLDPPLPLVDRQPEVLVFGSPLPHKLTTTALALIEGSEVLRKKGLRVRVIGGLPANFTLGPQIDRVPYLDQADLDRLLRCVRIVVYSSAYEGFGLPPVEAWASGTPCLYPAISPLLENLEGVPGSYHTSNAMQFEAELAALLELTDEQISQIARKVRDRFNWSSAAQVSVDTYRKVSRS